MKARVIAPLLAGLVAAIALPTTSKAGHDLSYASGEPFYTHPGLSHYSDLYDPRIHGRKHKVKEKGPDFKRKVKFKRFGRKVKVKEKGPDFKRKFKFKRDGRKVKTKFKTR